MKIIKNILIKWFGKEWYCKSFHATKLENNKWYCSKCDLSYDRYENDENCDCGV